MCEVNYQIELYTIYLLCIRLLIECNVQYCSNNNNSETDVKAERQLSLICYPIIHLM